MPTTGGKGEGVSALCGQLSRLTVQRCGSQRPVERGYCARYILYTYVHCNPIGLEDIQSRIFPFDSN